MTAAMLGAALLKLKVYRMSESEGLLVYDNCLSIPDFSGGGHEPRDGGSWLRLQPHAGQAVIADSLGLNQLALLVISYRLVDFLAGIHHKRTPVGDGFVQRQTRQQ